MNALTRECPECNGAGRFSCGGRHCNPGEGCDCGRGRVCRACEGKGEVPAQCACGAVHGVDDADVTRGRDGVWRCGCCAWELTRAQLAKAGWVPANSQRAAS